MPAMSTKRVVFLCYVLYFLTARWSVDTAEITTSNVVDLSENQQTSLTVASVQCTDGSNLVVSGTISPSAFCTFCFVVEPVNVATGSYEVVFYPSVADLTFSSVPEYDITLTCTDIDNTTNTATEVLEIRLTPNSAPAFTEGLTDQQAVSNTKDVTAGSALFTVDASDPNSDPIYYTLTQTVPASDNFQIGLTDGIVSAVNDLNTQCTQQIDLYITISDGAITVGPQIIDLTLQDPNDIPVIDNTEDRVFLPEDTVVGTSIMTLEFTDTTTNAEISFTTTPDAAFDLFTLDDNDLDLASELNYEEFNLRRPLVLFTVNDGGCTSTTFTYTVSVTDVNEAPVIGPENNVLDVYEGNIVEDPGWTTEDPDQGDTLTYSITASTPTTSNFEIDSSTGVISSTVEYDVDGGAMTATVTLTIQVEDEAGLTDSTELTISIKDLNDNDPEFTTLDQYFTVSSCSQVGSLLGTVAATDADSDFQDNNVISYSSSGGSDMVTITPGGNIILNSIPEQGTSETFTIIATDHGQFPNALSSIVSATVTVAGVECTTTTTSTASTTTSTTTTTTTTADPTNTSNSDEENLAWIILAALLGVAFLGLTAWLCMTRAVPYCGLARFSPDWVRSCQCNGEGLCQRRKPRAKVKPAPPPPPPVQVQPQSGNPGFWQEHYHDDWNYSHRAPYTGYQGYREKLPEPANYDPLPDTYHNLYSRERGKPAQTPDKGPRDLFDSDPMFKKDTARIWSTDVDPDFAPVNVNRRSAQNYDTMDGIL